MKRALAVLVVTLALAGPAGAASPLEDKLGAVASQLAGRATTVTCYDPAGWLAFVQSRGGDSSWNGYAFFYGTVHLSPVACSDLAAFDALVSQDCQVGTRMEDRVRTEYRWKRYRATVRGKRVWRRKRVAVRVPYSVPVAIMGGCPSSPQQAWSVTLLAHESQHVAGVVDEYQAECGAVQTTGRAAALLGAKPETVAATVQWTAAYNTTSCAAG